MVNLVAKATKYYTEFSKVLFSKQKVSHVELRSYNSLVVKDTQYKGVNLNTVSKQLYMLSHAIQTIQSPLTFTPSDLFKGFLINDFIFCIIQIKWQS